MKEYFLKVIEEQKGRPMHLALASLSGAGISYRVRNNAPNVIEYWVNKMECNIKGTLIFVTI